MSIGYFKTLQGRVYKGAKAGEPLKSGEFVQVSVENDEEIAKKSAFAGGGAEFTVVGHETEGGVDCVMFEVTKEFPTITYMVEQQLSPLAANGLQEPYTATVGELTRMKTPMLGEYILLEVEDADAYTLGQKVAVTTQLVPQDATPTPDPEP